MSKYKQQEIIVLTGKPTDFELTCYLESIGVEVLDENVRYPSGMPAVELNRLEEMLLEYHTDKDINTLYIITHSPYILNRLDSMRKDGFNVEFLQIGIVGNSFTATSMTKNMEGLMEDFEMEGVMMKKEVVVK